MGWDFDLSWEAFMYFIKFDVQLINSKNTRSVIFSDATMITVVTVTHQGYSFTGAKGDITQLLLV